MAPCKRMDLCCKSSVDTMPISIMHEAIPR